MVLQVPVHIDFQEGKNADFAGIRHGPPEFFHEMPHLVQVGGQPFVVVFRQFYPVFCVHFIGKSGIYENIFIGGSDAVWLHGGILFQTDGNEQHRGVVNGIGGLAFFPMDEAEGHVGHVDAGLFQKFTGFFMDVLYGHQWCAVGSVQEDFAFLPELPGIPGEKRIFSDEIPGARQFREGRLCLVGRICIADFGVENFKGSGTVHFFKQGFRRGKKHLCRGSPGIFEMDKVVAFAGVQQQFGPFVQLFCIHVRHSFRGAAIFFDNCPLRKVYPNPVRFASRMCTFFEKLRRMERKWVK